MALHTVCHIEWDVTDLERAQRFYGSLFNWKFDSFGDTMVVFASGDQHIGGFAKVGTVQAGKSPSVWIEVEDVDAYLPKAVAGGGSVVSPKQPVPHVGFSAVVGDPDGNAIGLVQFTRSE